MPGPISIPDLSSIGSGCALIIVPPFAGLRWPSLGVHLLEACAARAGFGVRVLYANLALAAAIGEETYEAIGCFGRDADELIGERFFAAAAYGRPALALPADGSDDERFAGALTKFGMKCSLAELRTLEARARLWVEELADRIAALSFPIVGATTTFEQTSSAIALLAAVKRRRPQTITILGGGNCEGPMAEGIMSLGTAVDYVFSGESEETFVTWLRSVKAGARPSERIVKGQIQLDMDQLPPPDYRSWFSQRGLFLGQESLRPEYHLCITYETSRGCWWGEKRHCTFCGLNGLGMRHREKSSEKVFSDLRVLLGQCPTNLVWLTDNIMPHRYFTTLLPRLQKEVPGVQLFYEEKSNLSLQKLRMLKAAGVVRIQPGIESLSTPLLRLMDKGATAAQNVALLRYALSVAMDIIWLILYRFPGDSAEHYEQMLALMPLLCHLPPPYWCAGINIDRFSPYYEQSARYGLRELRPLPAYNAVLPPGAGAGLVAYTFVADYDSAVDSKLEKDLQEAVAAWRQRWRGVTQPPALRVCEARPGIYFLVDTRGLPGARKLQILDEAQARAALVRNASPKRSSAARWAVAERAAVWLDGDYVPLATAAPELMARFEGEAHETFGQTVGLDVARR